ncbi:hypothetical protein ACFVKB_38510 [Rhodococcus sp. NPDC127530]|uniref:hypothetical protein n=1 Tax=unclassified Rhodococcus (in: high G+C Gram-positive bacteria) TaxID=192944 RepID=UPI003624F5F6
MSTGDGGGPLTQLVVAAAELRFEHLPDVSLPQPAGTFSTPSVSHWRARTTP